MQRTLLAAFLGLSVLALGASCNGSASDPPSLTTPQPLLAELGAETYARDCASCHGVEGHGDGPAASALRVAPADLTRIAARRGGRFPSGEIATYIDGRFELDAHGSRDMPVWGERLGEHLAPGVHPDEVARGRILTLIEHLKSIQQAE